MNRCLLLLSCALCAFIIAGCRSQPSSQSAASTPGAETPASTGAVSVTPAGSASADPAWEYSTDADPMGRGTTKYAQIESINLVDFDFPYQGGSKGTLMLRDSPKYGKNAILQVSSGQFLCDPDDCRVSLRVDEGRPIAISGSDAADGSSNVIFLPYAATLRYIQQARVLRIEADFYQAGSRVFEFHPRGLDLVKGWGDVSRRQ